jgi:hypothetical protein
LDYFIRVAAENPQADGFICCPCVSCRNLTQLDLDVRLGARSRENRTNLHVNKNTFYRLLETKSIKIKHAKLEWNNNAYTQ